MPNKILWIIAVVGLVLGCGRPQLAFTPTQALDIKAMSQPIGDVMDSTSKNLADFVPTYIDSGSIYLGNGSVDTMRQTGVVVSKYRLLKMMSYKQVYSLKLKQDSMMTYSTQIFMDTLRLHDSLNYTAFTTVKTELDGKKLDKAKGFGLGAAVAAGICVLLFVVSTISGH